MALSSLQKRVLSALIAGPATLAVIVLGNGPFLIFIGAGAAICFYEFFQMEKAGAHFARNMALWSLYIFLCAYAFIQLRAVPDEGLLLVLALMLTVWACDIGAYIAGKTIGGAKMAPTISPNKTYAGLIGGMVCSGLTLMGFDLAKDIFDVPAPVVFLTGFAFGAVGQAGDLMVSSLKRRVGVKDTGHLMPGHGGLLDRIDSLLLVTPVFLMACQLWLI
ncbi:MAG: phosphatidate cytidylyltransferase [Micavibrio aeruginosavorus]|nr:phosphatidate cytidylyltransferase [Micavibrio aeruginosavorus]